MELASSMVQVIGGIKLLAIDVDGVLTDGGVYIANDGGEYRRFNIKDGLGLKRAMEAGIEVTIISSGACESILHRARQLGINEVHIGVANKLDVLKSICSAKQISLDEVCYIGDDLPDLPVMQAVGLACAPEDAVEEVKQAALFVAQALGGHGAVRELIDILLNWKNHE